jgi:outer membrane protein
LQNNISVRQDDLQIRFGELYLHKSKLDQYPNTKFSGTEGYSAGRNHDPTKFIRITNGYAFNNYSLQSSVDLFNWFTKKNTIAANELSLKAAQEGIEKAKNDVALNVAVAYLQILLAREQIILAKSRTEQTRSQLESTRKQVDAGKLPELNAVNLEALLASDSASLISAETSAQQALLQMKAILNLDAAVPFDIQTPPVDMIPVEALGDLQPDVVYQLATNSLPQQKVDALNVQAARKSVEVARGSMYPTFSLFGSLGTAFNSRATEIKSRTPINVPVGTVTVNGTPYQVFPLNPLEVFTTGKINYFNQLNQNFRQSIGLAVSVPILNGGSLRTNWQRSKLRLQQTELQREANSFTLKQDIYKAYNDAVAALQTFNANKKTVESSQKAYDYATRRYELGLLSTYDLITTQNTLQQAKSQLLYSQYDYVFKMKLLEFYKGQGLKL